MVQNIITDLCHHLEIGIDGNLDIGNKRVIIGTPTITLSNNILTISCNTVGANIYYTLDGSTPTSSSTKYTSAVTLNNSCTIKAIAIKGNKSSVVVSQDYIAILSAWKIVGNSEVHGNEIWSCGEYNPTDGKYHILVQPLGGSIADIALTEPLRKTNDVADIIEFPSESEGKALVTRNLKPVSLEGKSWNTSNAPRYLLYIVGREYDFPENMREQAVILCSTYTTTTYSNTYNTDKTIGAVWNGNYNIISVRDTDVVTPATDIIGEVILKLTTPTTELVDAPQIEEADSYTCVISQGGKAVSWSSFTPNPT